MGKRKTSIPLKSVRHVSGILEIRGYEPRRLFDLFSDNRILPDLQEVEDYSEVEPVLRGLEERIQTSVDRNEFFRRFLVLKPKPVSYKKPRKESVIVKAGGKGDYVRRRTSEGEVVDVCECKFNADFSRGCISQVHGALLQEVLDNNGVYESDMAFRIYKAAGFADQRCGYCYAYRNMGNVAPRDVNEKTVAGFQEHHPDIIRIGKLTEAGHPYYWRFLKKFFELCKEHGSRIIFPTKTFPFGIQGSLETENFAFRNFSTVGNLARSVDMESGEEIAELLKEIDASLMYSIGYDSEERGAVTQGFSNVWRIQQAERHHEQRVNVSLTVVCDMAMSIENNVSRGSSVLDALESHARTGINLRLMPLRHPSRKLLARLGCGSYEDQVVYDPDIHDRLWLPGMETTAVYRKRRNREYIPLEMHYDFRRLYEAGIGICGIIDGCEHCDKCNLWDERIEFPESQLVQVESTKTTKPYGVDKKAGSIGLEVIEDPQQRLFE
ncbi:hypothetical protein GF386_06530 [Candidatus Pacearchaeota archaeon]|nr:hypothetical protein [Candidatus Pacearchaeota archaeon]MBD3283748.1 hypothetical protein [Candidatus Pacearchaeota archaeon]